MDEHKKKRRAKGKVVRTYLLGALLKSRVFYFLVMVLLFISLGYSKYKEFIFVPEQEREFRIDNFNLETTDGKRAFYMTEEDFLLSGELRKEKDSLFMSWFKGFYYNEYKKDYKLGRLMTQNIKVGPDQLPEIYKMVEDACSILGLNKIPGIYITGSQGTTITVTNFLDPVIKISGDFLWAFKPEELRFLLARSVAHIQLRHVYYLDLIRGMQSFTEALLPEFLAEILVGSIGLNLAKWYKEAEISADRGGLVVVGDIDSALNALVKLNIGSNYEDTYSPINMDSYIKQLEGFEEKNMRNLSATMAELNNENPFITVRVRHLRKWYEMNLEIFK